MKITAIKQISTGKNVAFITEDFTYFTLEEIVKKGEVIPLENVKTISRKSGGSYLRSVPNQNKDDNLDNLAITCNLGDYLLFDRKYIYLKALNGRVKKKWEAFSGNINAKISDQNKTDFGPLPEGEYVVFFDQTLKAENSTSKWDALKWYAKRNSWGEIATPLKQVSGETFGRGDFYLHGGKYKGTKGCIELNGDLNKHFYSFLTLYQRNFRLKVKYD